MYFFYLFLFSEIWNKSSTFPAVSCILYGKTGPVRITLYQGETWKLLALWILVTSRSKLTGQIRSRASKATYFRLEMVSLTLGTFKASFSLQLSYTSPRTKWVGWAPSESSRGKSKKQSSLQTNQRGLRLLSIRHENTMNTNTDIYLLTRLTCFYTFYLPQTWHRSLLFVCLQLCWCATKSRRLDRLSRASPQQSSYSLAA